MTMQQLHGEIVRLINAARDSKLSVEDVRSEIAAIIDEWEDAEERNGEPNGCQG